LYASRVPNGIDEPLVRSILVQSRRENPKHGITGLLCTHAADGICLQVLEGGRTHVNRLYANIVRDPRHEDVTMLDYQEIQERSFGGWRMGMVDLDKINPGTILRHSEQAALDPFTMSGPSAMALLEELVEGAAIVSSEGS
jgi:hypothetical protein